MAASNSEAWNFFCAFVKKEEEQEAQQQNGEQIEQSDSLPDAPPQFLHSTENEDLNDARTNAHKKKAKPRKKNAKRRAYNCGDYWKFWGQFNCFADLEAFRKDRGIYKQRAGERVYMFCAANKCTYKMLALENEHLIWDVYEKNAHNHTMDNIMPIGSKRRRSKKKKQIMHTGQDRNRTITDKNLPIGVKRKQETQLLNANKLSPNKQQKQHTSTSFQQQPRLVLKLRWTAASGFLPDRSSTSTASSSSLPLTPTESSLTPSSSTSTNFFANDTSRCQNCDKTPIRMAPAIFEFAKCGPQLHQIATEWHLLLKEKDASFLFMPQPKSKAFKDGILLSLTDCAKHIRMDEFRLVRLQRDKIQRWPKELGHATIMRFVREQCARLFPTDSAQN